MEKGVTDCSGKHLKNGETSPTYNLMGQIKTNKWNGRKKFRVTHVILMDWMGWPQTSPSLF
jgi:hypothetical protein